MEIDPAADVAALRREIAGLRLELAALRDERAANPRLRLSAARDTALLGQRIAVWAEVADGRGAPLSGRGVTLAATAGGLRRPGSLAPPAAGLALVTDDDGFARAELASTLDHALGADERAALEVALAPFLATLAPDTRFDPGAAGDALVDLARGYRLHGNLALQSAVDACFRTADAPRMTGGDSGGGGGQNASAWRTVPVALLAQVSDAGAAEPSAVIAGAVLVAAFYDWRGPFLEALRALARAESTLPRQLLAERQETEVEALPGRLYDRVRRFVSDQRGEIGQAVARGHAEEALVSFLDQGAGDLSVDQRRALFPALALGSSALAAGATTTLAAVGQARTDLKKVIDRRPNVDVGPIVDRLDAAEAAILVKADRRALDDALSGVEDRFGAEAAARGDLGLRIDAKLDRTGLDAALGSVRSDLAARLDQEASARLELGRRIASQGQDFKALLDEERTARIELGRKIDQHRTLVDTSVGDLRAALATETGARTDLAAKLDAEALARARLATALEGEVNARTTLANLVATKADAAQIADLRARTEATSSQVATIQTSIRRIDADITTIRLRPPSGPTG